MMYRAHPRLAGGATGVALQVGGVGSREQDGGGEPVPGAGQGRTGELGAVVVPDEVHGGVGGHRVDHCEQVGNQRVQVEGPIEGEGAYPRRLTAVT